VGKVHKQSKKPNVPNSDKSAREETQKFVLWGLSSNSEESTKLDQEIKKAKNTRRKTQ
jgi:hypothetical protein